jgi:hypothetical protein
MTGVPRAEQQPITENLLEQLDITRVRHQQGYTLSGGERRRTEIARIQLDHELEMAQGTLRALENPRPGLRVTQGQLRAARSAFACAHCGVAAPSSKRLAAAIAAIGAPASTASGAARSMRIAIRARRMSRAPGSRPGLRP